MCNNFSNVSFYSMRLEDFSAYKYSIRKLSEDSDNAYVMEVPLADYEDTYVDIIFTREDKTINMKVPHIISKAGDEIDVKGNTFYIDTGIDDDIEGVVQGFIRDIKSKEFTSDSLNRKHFYCGAKACKRCFVSAVFIKSCDGVSDSLAVGGMLFHVGICNH